jgi:hypothetical protein
MENLRLSTLKNKHSGLITVSSIQAINFKTALSCQKETNPFLVANYYPCFTKPMNTQEKILASTLKHCFQIILTQAAHYISQSYSNTCRIKSADVLKAHVNELDFKDAGRIKSALEA